jgi:hypothetical protein
MRRNRYLPFWAGLMLAALGACPSQGQEQVPLISGAAGLLFSKDAGQAALQPILTPVLVVPIGSRFLVEASAELQGYVARATPGGPFLQQEFTTIEYLQLDYVANSYLTIVAGRFLTPFNIYNERLGPIWIHNLQDGPLIYPIGTRTTGSSDGVMLRGVAVSRPEWLLNYTAFFSVLSNVSNLEAGRAFGTRVGLFIPKARLEVGSSYQRFLQDQHTDSYGVYLSWLPTARVEVKAEYAHSPQGYGYWIEGAYRFSESGLLGRELKNIQPIIRGQQFFRLAPGVGDQLPQADTQRVDFGLNYYFPHEIRLNGSYGRQLSSSGNSNNWTLDLTYRFLFPMPFWPKGAK